ncbi:hypothetical protein GCK32_014540 [Trichostrongylus colubriformis]|uniref:Uncharacterized protein n=1 Tax=Trichostrongylus colubriformis TaxID=6319 RepID=A0AAN8FNV8_TRICO
MNIEHSETCFKDAKLRVKVALKVLKLKRIAQLRGSFEKDHRQKNYPEWPVMGSAWDLIMPTNISRPDSAILDPVGIFSNSTPECAFLDMKKLDDGGVFLNIQLIYAPMTATTVRLMELVKDRYTTTISRPLFGLGTPTMPKYFQSNMSVNGTP